MRNWGHMVFGMGLLLLAWANMWLGIKLYHNGEKWQRVLWILWAAVSKDRGAKRSGADLVSCFSFSSSCSSSATLSFLVSLPKNTKRDAPRWSARMVSAPKYRM